MMKLMVQACTTWTTCQHLPKPLLLHMDTVLSSPSLFWTDTTDQVNINHLKDDISLKNMFSCLLFVLRTDLTREEAVDLLKKCLEEVSCVGLYVLNVLVCSST